MMLKDNRMISSKYYHMKKKSSKKNYFSREWVFYSKNFAIAAKWFGSSPKWECQVFCSLKMILKLRFSKKNSSQLEINSSGIRKASLFKILEKFLNGSFQKRSTSFKMKKNGLLIIWWIILYDRMKIKNENNWKMLRSFDLNKHFFFKF